MSAEWLHYPLSMPTIHKVGLLTVKNDRVLLCRKRHTTSALILPGGKPQHLETATACLFREVAEELGNSVSLSRLRHTGSYQHRAAHDNPRVQLMVAIELYQGIIAGTPEPCAEIQQLVWFKSDDDWDELAPSLSELVFPDLIARGILPWHQAH